MPGRAPFLPTDVGTRKLLQSAYGGSKLNSEITEQKDASPQVSSPDSTGMGENPTEANKSPKETSTSAESSSPPDFSLNLPQQIATTNNLDETQTDPSTEEVKNSRETSLSRNHRQSDVITPQQEIFVSSSKVESKSAKIVGNTHALSETSFSPMKRHHPFSITPRLPSFINDDPFSPASLESEESIFFPLECAAAGNVPCPSVKDAKKMESDARRRTKEEKRAIAEAKLAVTEARLEEFEAKLRARQARVDERHATLCRKRAIIKRAEDRLLDLEFRLDQDENAHRKREEDMRIRERRVKQEEIRVHIQEANLKKREEKVIDVVRDIERRKKIVEEKEIMSSLMNDVIGKKPDSSSDATSKTSPASPSSRGNPFKLKNASDFAEAIRRKENKLSKSISPTSNSKQIVSILPPTSSPLKSPENSASRSNMKRSGSYDSELVFGNPTPYSHFNISSLPRPKSKAVMGLWL